LVPRKTLTILFSIKNGLGFSNDIEPLFDQPVFYTYKEGYREGVLSGGDYMYNIIKIIWSPISLQILFGTGTFI
jgi:hypothetical protein